TDEMCVGIVTNDIYPLVPLVVRLEELGREIAGIVRLGFDRLAPPREVVLHFFSRHPMRKNHRRGRFSIVVAGKQQQMRGLRKTSLDSRRESGALRTRQPSLHRI